MIVKEIIRILHAYQKWRRGENIPMPDPKEIGRAIDGAIRELRNFQRVKIRMEKESNSKGFSKKREELLRWRDPNVEMPDKSKEDWVLIRVQYSDGFIGLPQIGEFRDDGLWHSVCHDDLKLGESFEEMYGCKVIGWRPIQEE